MRSYVQIAFSVIFGLSLCFAQETPPKLAVYVSGAENAGVNKSLSVKLFVAMTQSGIYAEITDPALFQDDIAKSGKSDLASIAQTAKRQGADYICVVGMTEAFGTYSITARLAKVSDLQIMKTGSIDRQLKSHDDLTAVSSELTRQLLPSGSYVPPPPAPVAATPIATVAATPDAPKQCKKKYNINEILFKVKNGLPSKLKDCSSGLAKEMALAASPFGKKGAPIEPKSYMTQCAVNGIKNEIPDGFPGKNKLISSVNNFVQGLLNSAMAGGSLDPRKLISVVGSMDINGLMSDVKKLASYDCVVDEPYEPPVAQARNGGYSDDEEDEEEGAEGEKESSSILAVGISVLLISICVLLVAI